MLYCAFSALMVLVNNRKGIQPVQTYASKPLGMAVSIQVGEIKSTVLYGQPYLSV